VTIPDHSQRSLTELFSLAGRRAVVTGGARGLGAQIVRRLAEAGADVVVADLDGAGASAVAAEVAAATGRRVIGSRLDVGDSASLAEVADRAVGELGGLDIWVNNAGIFPTTGNPLEVSDEFLDRMLQINTRGTYAGAREAARRMTQGGVIINLASTAGFKAAPGISAYVMSKHAVVGITKALALEFGPLDVRVLAVAPTVMDTPGVADQLAPLKAAGLDIAAQQARNPLGRMGVADDVARVVVFACSDLAAFMTGSVLAVDAGALA
jgi:NAD(P)-dependent dehydrogenase (short-subunit alcohol dehydrogenase family)